MTGKTTKKTGPRGEILGLDRRQLLARHLEGDENAFQVLLDLYKRPVYAYLSRCGVEPDTRDDLFQEIFLKIHLAAGQYQPDCPLKPWIYTIVANTVRSFYRKQRIRQMVYQEDMSDHPSESNDASDYAEAREAAEWLQQQIQMLPFRQREAVLMCAVSRMDQKSVARVLGLSLNTLKTNLRRARMTLAKRLIRHRAGQGKEVSK